MKRIITIKVTVYSKELPGTLEFKDVTLATTPLSRDNDF